MIHIELFGVPRLRAGVHRLAIEADSVGQALRSLARECPSLADSIGAEDRLHPAYRLSLNGETFLTDPETPLNEGDVLLLLSADVGG